MLLLYIRHGDPIYDPNSLTPLGLRQAEAVGHRLATIGLDEIFASSSNRAQLTAQPAAEITKLPVQVLDWCSEERAWEELTCTYPDGGRTWCFYDDKVRSLFLSPEVMALGRAWYTHPAFAGTRFAEGMQRIQRECDAFMAAHGYVHEHDRYGYRAASPNRKRVAMFAHHGFGLAFLSCLLDIPYPLFATRFDLMHTGVTAIQFEAAQGEACRPMVQQLSGDSHLLQSGLPTLFGQLPR